MSEVRWFVLYALIAATGVAVFPIAYLIDRHLTFGPGVRT